MRAAGRPDETRWPARVAGVAFACMLVVIAASAYIRLAGAFPALTEATALARGAHRLAASLAGIAALALAWLAYRGRAPRGAAYAALAITLLLASVGAAFGTAPPAAAALANVLGGLALATLFAWAHGKAATVGAPWSSKLAFAALALACAQAALGAWIGTRPEPVGAGALLAHLLLGAITALAAGWLGVRLAPVRPALGLGLLAAAASAPLAGALSAFLEPPAELAMLHPVAAAWLLAMLSYGHASPHRSA
jgi:hypothetical protein